MSPLLLQHASYRSNRTSIMEKGLLPHAPGIDGNYPELHGQPRGVYVTLAGSTYPWRSGWDADLYEFTYVGPVLQDPALGPGWPGGVLPDAVPPEALRLTESDQ